MIKIYHLDNSRSERIVWLMEELGLPYEQQTFMRERGLAPEALRAIHPAGTAPLIQDGDQVIMESGAIVEYIINRYGSGKLMPAISSPDYAQYLQWLHYTEGSAMSSLLREFSLRRALGDKADQSPSLQMSTGRSAAMLRFIDARLASSSYLAGAEFSAADIMMEFCFSFLERYAKRSIDEYPHIAAWLHQLRSRPAYQRMLSVAAPQVLP